MEEVGRRGSGWDKRKVEKPKEKEGREQRKNESERKESMGSREP